MPSRNLLLLYIIKSADNLQARTRAYARDYFWKSWWCILSTAFFLAAASAGTFPGLLVALRLACSGLSGLLIVRLFVIYHDRQPHAILPKSHLAELFMRLFGIWALSPSSLWRSSHDYHHAHNSKLRSSRLGSFPIMTSEQYRIPSPAVRFKYLFMRHPLTILFGYIFVFLFGMVLCPIFNSPRKHYDCLLALLLHVMLGVALVVLFGWWTRVLVLILPHLLACALGSCLF